MFRRASLADRDLFAASQAGLVNNLNDGLSWGVFPLFFAAAGLSVKRIGLLAGVYPAVWGTLQVPSLLAIVADTADPGWRARALSVYRFWRDLGYAVGALAAGLLTAVVGLAWAIAAVGALTSLSGGVIAVLMRDKPRRR